MPKLKYGTPKVVKHIQKVVQETDIPSWLNALPPNIGEAAVGSLKADEWRTFATIYLPLALVELWGEGSTHASDEIAISLYQVLDHTMKLLSAIHLACLKTVNEYRLNAYRGLISEYIRDLPELHPDISIHPNHHLAHHVYDFLKLFGPVQSWWCFPFENVIGILQRFPSNDRLGVSPSTIKLVCKTDNVLQGNMRQLCFTPLSVLVGLEAG